MEMEDEPANVSPSDVAEGLSFANLGRYVSSLRPDRVFERSRRSLPLNLRANLKLIVGVVIDQFRYDYLTRFRADYHGGLDRLLSSGANFTNAHYLQRHQNGRWSQHLPDRRHARVSGIVSNEWYDRIRSNR